MPQWLVPSLIAALATLLTAFGLHLVTRRNVEHDKKEEGQATVSVARLGAEAALLGLLLDRIDKLEKRSDEQSVRSQIRQEQIEALQTARDDCKHELTDLVAAHALLKEQFEKQIARLTNGPKT